MLWVSAYKHSLYHATISIPVATTKLLNTISTTCPKLNIVRHSELQLSTSFMRIKFRGRGGGGEEPRIRIPSCKHISSLSSCEAAFHPTITLWLTEGVGPWEEIISSSGQCMAPSQIVGKVISLEGAYVGTKKHLPVALCWTSVMRDWVHVAHGRFCRD